MSNVGANLRETVKHVHAVGLPRFLGQLQALESGTTYYFLLGKLDWFLG